ncbi:transglutaminaseTgpA domain-containing protein [Bifidobacterium felsineum]|nr:transglutaminaseTgpA domain-containing protein [Bifidobacterium felsineum]
MPKRLQRQHHRRHGLIRPTVGGLVLLAAGGASCFGGLLLDERMLMDTTIAIAILFVCSLVMIMLQWFGVLAIGRPQCRKQIEQRDQFGHTVARMIGDPPANRRGRYVTLNTAVHWIAPLGLFAATKIVPTSEETLVLPQVKGPADGDGVAADMRQAGTSHQEQSGGVRTYAPGDPLKLISWKHTARRGELMTRETGRDARPTIIVVLHSDTSAEQLDVQVASVLSVVRAAGKRRQRIIATDGVQCHEGIADIERFLAAVRPAESGPASSREAAIRRLTTQGPSLVVDAMEVQPLVVEFSPRKPVSQEVFFSTRGWLPLLISFAIALNALTGLIAPTGMWIWFAAASFATVAIGSVIPSARLAMHIHRPRWAVDICRIVAFAVMEILVVAVLSIVHLKDLLAPIWHQGGLAANLADSWRLYTSTVVSGFDALNLQLPPLKVVGHADLFLLLLVAAAALLIRLVLIWRVARPIMAVLPVTALAADYALAGHTAPLWAIGLVVAAFPLLLWAAHPERTHPDMKFETGLRGHKHTSLQMSRIRLAAPAARAISSPFSLKGPGSTLSLAPLLAVVLAVTITVPLTAPAAELAYQVPLSIGEGGGMFTSNTVSPMIDLKRNIEAGSDATVLTYQAYKRSYMRLTTLDNFDGDSWGYDRELALDAGLYGSGIQLGRNSEDELTREQRRGMNPLSMYMYSLGYDGYMVATSNRNTLEQFMVNATVRIDTLKSRFLPVPGMASYVEGAGADWLMYQDGTVYNRTSGTSADTTYTVFGADFDPITNSSGFSKLSVITDAKNSLIGTKVAAGEEEKNAWYQARRNLADTGLVSVQDDTLIINATISDDGSIIGPSGWYLGKASDDGGEVRIADGKYISMPSGIVFDDTVVDQLGFGRDDYVIGVGAPNTLVLAMPIIDVVGTQAMDGGVATFYGQDLWTSQALAALRRMNSGLSGYTMMVGSDSDVSNPITERLKQYVERSDEHAHESRYTSLPERLPANIRAVIQQAQAAGISITSSSYDDQVRAMRWLVEYFTNPENKFTYSLDAPDGDGRDNLEVINDFLDPENGHSGYCQHYASALAVLGRALGVPTRIVIGYNAGVEPRGKDGFFTVQSKQLHAWVEAYMDGVGWVPFDVTPATTENGSASSDSGTSSSDTSDSNSAAASDGSDAAVTPDQSQTDGQAEQNSNTGSEQSSDAANNADKQQFADTVADGSGNIWAEAADRFMANPTWLRVLIIAALVLALVGAGCGAPRLWRWLRRRRVLVIIDRAKAAPDNHKLVAAAWQAAWHEVRRAAKKPKPAAADTDMDIAEAIAQQYPDCAEAVLAIARNATASTFGGTSKPVDGLAEQLKALWSLAESRR